LRQFDGGFTAIPNRVLENNILSLGARMTYGMLLKYAWQKDFCFPAQQQLASDLGITDRSVRSYLKELRDARLVDWKQMGLNRPNRYFILKLPDRVAASGRTGPENISAPDRKPASAQDRKPASDKEHSRKNTHTVVNDGVGNEPNKSRPIRDQKTPAISARALRAKYGLDDAQIGRVAWLVEKQADVLGAADRNHAHYVQRAAEAVRDGQGDLLDQVLGDFKQAATEIAVGSRPGYFHAMYADALDRLGAQPPAFRQPTTHPRHQAATPDDSSTRFILDAERRGFAVPDHVRTADVATLTRWWAGLNDADRH
jgi:hypothetical protein